jgi:two-component system LytT family sensor kinase
MQKTLALFDNEWVDLRLIGDELSHMCVLFAIVYLFSKYSPIFSFLVKNSLRRRDWLWLYVLFSSISILGTLLAIKVPAGQVADAWALVNIRSIGAVLGGLLGGPWLGAAVGFTSGVVRYLNGGATALACGVETTLAGLIAGWVHLIVLKYKSEQRFSWIIAFLTTLFVELLGKGLVYWSVKDSGYGLNLIQAITIPMVLSNSLGVALCVGILNDYDRLSAKLSGDALNIARRMTEILQQHTRFRPAATALAQLIQQETGAASVAFTGKTRLFAFVGLGKDHHHSGSAVTNNLIRTALTGQKTVYVDGHSEVFHCRKSHQCPLHSAFIAPLVVDGETQGTLVLFEPKNRFFPRVNRDLAENIASLLAEQIETARYAERLANLENKYLQTRINPHFFANALTTIKNITRTDTPLAGRLLDNLSTLMRELASPENNGFTLQQERKLLEKYLSIEEARFGERLQISINIDPNIETMRIPRFVLQLLVENAIKNGTSKQPKPTVGKVVVHAQQIEDQLVQIEVWDNAGLYHENRARKPTEGYGMKMVADLIKSHNKSDRYGICVDCDPGVYTSVIIFISLPFDA